MFNHCCHLEQICSLRPSIVLLSSVLLEFNFFSENLDVDFSSAPAISTEVQSYKLLSMRKKLVSLLRQHLDYNAIFYSFIRFQNERVNGKLLEIHLRQNRIFLSRSNAQKTYFNKSEHHEV